MSFPLRGVTSTFNRYLGIASVREWRKVDEMGEGIRGMFHHISAGPVWAVGVADATSLPKGVENSSLHFSSCVRR